jgi:predicted Zn-ribbon and HTH transcriptional regulator
MSGDGEPETVTLTRWTCQRCGHKWLPRKQGRPHLCPNCKSVKWDEPKTTKEVA